MTASQQVHGPPATVVVARNSVWLALDAVLAIVAGTVMSIAVARVLGPELLGYYAFLMFTVSAAGVIGSRGVAIAGQRYAAEAVGRTDVRQALAVIRLALRWQLRTAAVLCSFGLLVTWLMVAPQHRVYASLAILSLGPAFVMSAFAAAIAAAEQARENTWPSMVGVACNLSLSMWALWSGWGLSGLAASLLVSRTVDCGLRYIAFRHVYRRLGADQHELATAGQVDVESRASIGRFVREATVLMAFDLVVWDRSELLILQYSSPSAQLAFFSLSFNLVQQVLALPRMFVWAVGSRLYTEQGRSPDRVATLAATSIHYLALVSIPACLGLAALAEPLIMVMYGAAYAPAVPVLQVVAVLMAARGILMPAQDMMRAGNQQAILVRWSLWLAIVNVGLDLALIPGGGAMGAALANGLAQSAGVVGIVWLAGRTMHLRLPVRTLALAVTASTGMALSVGLLVRVLPPLPALVLAVPFGLLTYVAGLRWLAVLGPSDRQRLQQFIPFVPASAVTAYSRLVDLLVSSERSRRDASSEAR